MILSYNYFGQGAPLIILHGLFGSSDNWQSFAKSIADQYQVITIDIRNHGNSSHVDDFDFDLIHHDLIETLNYIGIDRYDMMGHSMGGKAAMVHALHCRDQVKKLIIIDIAPKAYPPHHEIYFNVMRSMDFDLISNRMQADAWMQKDIADLAVRQFLLKNLIRDENNRFKWKFNLESLYKHYDEINVELKSEHPFTRPTLFIKGERSEYIKTNDESLIHDLFPHAEIITIMNAGHWVHADQPIRLKEVVLDFLKKSIALQNERTQ